MAFDTQANWVNIDVETLTEEQALAYETYKDAQRAAAKLRADFEGIMSEGVPFGRKMIFGYRFGKLSVALVEDDRKAAKPKQATKSLAEYLAEQNQ